MEFASAILSSISCRILSYSFSSQGLFGCTLLYGYEWPSSFSPQTLSIVLYKRDTWDIMMMMILKTVGVISLIWWKKKISLTKTDQKVVQIGTPSFSKCVNIMLSHWPNQVFFGFEIFCLTNSMYCEKWSFKKTHVKSPA